MPRTKAFMTLRLTQKGVLVEGICERGCLVRTHEWASADFNDERDNLLAGRARCPECLAKVPADTVKEHGRTWYAGRYSASGYMDCTPWEYGRNARRLRSELRALYEL